MCVWGRRRSLLFLKMHKRWLNKIVKQAAQNTSGLEFNLAWEHFGRIALKILQKVLGKKF